MKRLVSLLVAILLLSSMCYAEQNDLYDKMVELLGQYDKETVQTVNDASRTVLADMKTWQLTDNIMYTVGKNIMPGRYMVHMNDGGRLCLLLKDQDNVAIKTWIDENYFRFSPRYVEDWGYCVSIVLGGFAGKDVGIELIDGLVMFVSDTTECTITKVESEFVIGK